MSIQEFLPQIWSGLILSELEKNLVYADCCNRNYEKDMVGNTVYINEISDIDISNYTKNSTSLTYQTLDSAQQSFKVDQVKSFSFKIDDVDAAQSSAPVLTAATKKAVYSIADEVDQFIATFYSTAGVTASLGTTDSPIEINSTNVVNYLLKLQRALDDVSCPNTGRFVVVPPWFDEDILLSGAPGYFQPVGDLTNGVCGRMAGFDIKKSVNVPNTAGDAYKIIAGSTDAITFAMKIESLEALRIESSFSDAMRGLFNYGALVQQPNALAVLTANEASEAA